MLDRIISIVSLELVLFLLVGAVIGLIIYRKQSQGNRRVKISKRVKRPNYSDKEPPRVVKIDGELYSDIDAESDIPVLLDPADDILDNGNTHPKQPFQQPTQQLDMFDESPEIESRQRTRTNKSKPKSATKTVKKTDQDLLGDLIIINLQAADDTPFLGKRFFEILQANNLRFGERDIFHYHPDDTSDAWFKMANGINPGTFDYHEQEYFSSPVMCFILELQKEKVNQHGFHIDAYNQMIVTIKIIQQEYSGRLKDSGHSDLNEQGIEHYRQKVQDFERQGLIFT